ncbi:MAG: electron transport complex subunit RsxB [Burkholderiales bacterium]|nr:electron transport complex subunit RsxB [Burkholderiales bacterium]MDR4518419.1 electron transport complex subunit RsxB [Nitrosomonas sp.]
MSTDKLTEHGLRERIKEIDAILPQTHCRQCGFSGCEPYAAAIAEGQADINQCPPGDADVIHKIAKLLGIEPKPLNTRHGLPKPRAVAVIDENRCIGCTFCIRACPVDAIVGAAKQMHTVITDECTGCELCVAPCPMDCISMIPVTGLAENVDATSVENRKRADRARMRYQFRLQRLEQKKLVSRKKTKADYSFKSGGQTPSKMERKQAVVQAALKRAAAMRAQQINDND